MHMYMFLKDLQYGNKILASSNGVLKQFLFVVNTISNLFCSCCYHTLRSKYVKIHQYSHHHICSIQTCFRSRNYTVEQQIWDVREKNVYFNIKMRLPWYQYKICHQEPIITNDKPSFLVAHNSIYIKFACCPSNAITSTCGGFAQGGQLIM